MRAEAQGETAQGPRGRQDQLHLRTDPYQRADITSNSYYEWLLDRVFLMLPAQAQVGEFLASFRKYPPRQAAASFTIDQVMERLTSSIGR